MVFARWVTKPTNPAVVPRGLSGASQGRKFLQSTGQIAEIRGVLSRQVGSHRF